MVFDSPRTSKSSHASIITPLPLGEGCVLLRFAGGSAEQLLQSAEASDEVPSTSSGIFYTLGMRRGSLQDAPWNNAIHDILRSKNRANAALTVTSMDIYRDLETNGEVYRKFKYSR